MTALEMWVPYALTQPVSDPVQASGEVIMARREARCPRVGWRRRNFFLSPTTFAEYETTMSFSKASGFSSRMFKIFRVSRPPAISSTYLEDGPRRRG